MSTGAHSSSNNADSLFNWPSDCENVLPNPVNTTNVKASIEYLQVAREYSNQLLNNNSIWNPMPSKIRFAKNAGDV